MEDRRPTGGRWRYAGLGILKGQRPSGGSPHGPGLEAGAAHTQALEGARRIRERAAPIEPAGPGPTGSGAEPIRVLYVVRGRARLRWGLHGEFMSEAEAGDFVAIPSGTPWRLVNGAPGRILECLEVDPEGDVRPRSVDDVDPAGVQEVLWVDPVRSDV